MAIRTKVQVKTLLANKILKDMTAIAIASEWRTETVLSVPGKRKGCTTVNAEQKTPCQSNEECGALSNAVCEVLLKIMCLMGVALAKVRKKLALVTWYGKCGDSGARR